MLVVAGTEGGTRIPTMKANIGSDGTVLGLTFDWAAWANQVTESTSSIIYSTISGLVPIWEFIDDADFKKEVENEILYRTQKNPVPNLIQIKWNNLLYIDSNQQTHGGYDFTSYQWFVDDIMISKKDFGQSAYLSITGSPLPFNKPYYCVMFTSKGEIIKSTTLTPKK